MDSDSIDRATQCWCGEPKKAPDVPLCDGHDAMSSSALGNIVGFVAECLGKRRAESRGTDEQG